MELNTGKIRLHHARSDGTEYWIGGFISPSTKSWPILAQVDDNGYKVVIWNPDYSTEMSKFTIPHFNDNSIQFVKTELGRIVQCARSLNRIDIALLPR